MSVSLVHAAALYLICAFLIGGSFFFGLTLVGYIWELAAVTIIAVAAYTGLRESAYIRRVAKGLRCAFTNHAAIHDPISYHDNDTILRIDLRCTRCGCGGVIDLQMEGRGDGLPTFAQPFGPAGRGF